LWYFANLIRQLAYHGEWQPVFEFLAEQVNKQTSIRDYLTGEKVIQTFLLAYLNVTDYYLTHSEAEMGKGFVDLYLEPFLEKYQQVKYSYLIELKYIKRSDFSESLLQQHIVDATQQLQQYAADSRLKKTDGTELKLIMLIFNGWELVHCQEIEESD
jgi:hypothetical protein